MHSLQFSVKYKKVCQRVSPAQSRQIINNRNSFEEIHIFCLPLSVKLKIYYGRRTITKCGEMRSAMQSLGQCLHRITIDGVV